MRRLGRGFAGRTLEISCTDSFYITRRVTAKQIYRMRFKKFIFLNMSAHSCKFLANYIWIPIGQDITAFLANTVSHYTYAPLVKGPFRYRQFTYLMTTNIRITHSASLKAHFDKNVRAICAFKFWLHFAQGINIYPWWSLRQKIT